MAASDLIRVLLQAFVAVRGLGYDPKNGSCQKFRTDSHFEIDKIVGKIWRAYYSWDMHQDLSDKCHDLTFKNATPRVSKFYFICVS